MKCSDIKPGRSYLSQEIARYAKIHPSAEIVEYVDGLISSVKQSNLGKALLRAQAQHPDKEVTYLVGGHRRNGPDGWHMVVVIYDKEEEE